MKRTTWTTSQRRRVARACVEQLASILKIEPQAVTKANIVDQSCFFAKVFTPAQLKVFEAERHLVRKINQHAAVPWLIQDMLLEVGLLKQEAATRQAEEAERVQKNDEEERLKQQALSLTFSLKANPHAINAVVSILVPALVEPLADALLARMRENGATMKAPCVPMTGERPPSEPKKVKVLIYGLLPQQQQSVTKDFGAKFDLHFLEKQLGKRLDAHSECEYAFSCIKISHGASSKMHKMFGSGFKLVNGPSSIKRELHILSTQLGK